VRVHVSLRSAGVCALLASLGTLGLAGSPATIAAAATAGPGLASSAPPVNRSNVGATHSPQLLQQLAGPAGASGPVIGGPRNALIAGPAAAAGSVAGAAQGVDVASFQESGGINWQQVASDGVKFAVIKVTEGAYYTNKFALTDLPAAKAAGLSTAAYAFAIPNGGSSGSTQFSADPVVQADDLINYLTSNGLTVPAIMLDIEYDPYAGQDGTPAGSWCYGLSQSAMVTWISSFVSEVQAKTGWLPIIYTPAQWWTKCTGDSTAFGQAPVWVPVFGSSPPTLSAGTLPMGWSTWNFWQYASTGTVTGIPDAKNTDLDLANPAMITLLDSGLRQSMPNQSTDEGSPVGRQLNASDSSGQTPTFTAAGLPPGLSISSSGQLTGWPDVPGTYHPTVTATDGLGGSGSASFTWTESVAPNTGPSGAVRLATGGKCLNDVGNKSANGTQADIWTCNGSTAQQWMYVQDGTLRIHGKCLVPPSSSPASGAKVVLAACTGAPLQQWWLTYPRSISPSLGAIPATLLNPASGMCLSDTGWSTANGTRVVAGSCNGFKNQAWTLPAGPVSSRIPGKCMDDSGNGTANGTKIDISSCNGTSGQQWTTGTDGTVRVHGKCLDVQQGGTASGTPVDLWSCTGTGAQQWQLVPGGGGVSLVNPQSGLCLADPGNATVNGTGLQIATCAGIAGQAWRAQ
jgi:GH25 family lysozyme M1 (1,4-beta-N-acetylmuramidase)